jgi:DNA-binding LacI/PurR family transcriptional regulator
MTTIKDVAEKAGVSVATVSRVINHKAIVRPSLRARVEKVIAELSYSPSGIAKNMRKQTLRSIGVILADILNPFFTHIVRIIEERAYQDSFSVILCNSNEDPDKEAAHLEFLQAERVAGVIWAPVGYVRKYSEISVPLVLLDRLQPGILADSVMVDNTAGVRLAVKHLVELGHHRIGMISGPINTSTGVDRLKGYKIEVEQNGLTFDNDLVVFSDFKESGGIEATKKLLDRRDPPTAIIAGNNLMTVGVLMVLRERGICLPDQMSLVGFDDMPWYSLVSPPITVIKQPVNELGRVAIDLLLRRVSNDCEDFPLQVNFHVQLIVRGSTSHPRDQIP